MMFLLFMRLGSMSKPPRIEVQAPPGTPKSPKLFSRQNSPGKEPKMQTDCSGLGLDVVCVLLCLMLFFFLLVYLSFCVFFMLYTCYQMKEME